MAQDPKKARGAQAPAAQATDGGEEANGDLDAILARVRRHLDEGRPDKALEVVRQARIKSPWLSNAAGVCQIRLGNAEAAVETFRGLVVAAGVLLREDAPPAFKLNFAAALLAAGNVDGFLSALGDVGDAHPAAARYREAYRRWRSRLSPWQRFRMLLGGPPPRSFEADFPLGEV
jgi:hypothetical protein